MPHPGRILRLTSNGCRAEYPQNSGWNFTNIIDRFYVFDSQSGGRQREVEIALTDIFVPSSYRNVTASGGWFELYVRANKKAELTLHSRLTLPTDFYGDLGLTAKLVNGLILTSMKRRLTRQRAPVTIVHNPKTGHSHLAFADGQVGIRMGVDIARLWGFVPAQLYSAPPGHDFGAKMGGKDFLLASPYTGSVHSNRGSLFIHCSGIEQTMIGPLYVSVMQVASWLPGTAANSVTRHLEFQHPVFHRLVDRGADYLTIEIRDSANLPVEFFGGNTIVTLLVRERA
jgi:hypothetical protein